MIYLVVGLVLLADVIGLVWFFVGLNAFIKAQEGEQNGGHEVEPVEVPRL